MSEKKGSKNRYTCNTCRLAIITIVKHEGTTPFTVGCRRTARCRGAMQSHMGKDTYDKHYGEIPGFWEFYRPSKAECRRIRKQTKHHEPILDHVACGGLLLRRRGELSPHAEEAAR